jgi:hypothetical protein
VPVGSKGESCACPATYLNIGACCLSQNWIIGLACGSGGLLLLIFIVVVSWLCVTKSAAVAAAAKLEESRRDAAIDTVAAYQHAVNGHVNSPPLEIRFILDSFITFSDSSNLSLTRKGSAAFRGQIHLVYASVTLNFESHLFLQTS